MPPPTSVVHPCYSCAATFDTTEKLNTHRKKHIGEKPFACDTCDKKFAFYTLCEMHKLQHTPEWPELRKDTKKLAELKRQFILNRRNWRMRLYQPPVRKQCPQCPRSFKWAAGLERHLRWHRNGMFINLKNDMFIIQETFLSKFPKLIIQKLTPIYIPSRAFLHLHHLRLRVPLLRHLKNPPSLRQVRQSHPHLVLARLPVRGLSRPAQVGKRSANP